jgi:hypothetical protein
MTWRRGRPVASGGVVVGRGASGGGRTLLEATSTTAPIGMNTAPTRKKVMITAFGVRMGRQAGRFCCLKRESAAAAARRQAGRAELRRARARAVRVRAAVRRRRWGAQGGGAGLELTRRPLALRLLDRHG